MIFTLFLLFSKFLFDPRATRQANIFEKNIEITREMENPARPKGVSGSRLNDLDERVLQLIRQNGYFTLVSMHELRQPIEHPFLV